MIKAIETYYNGYRFRSRLEARWAVFFDSLKIRWLYEPEGFSIDGQLYLPDFYLPDCKQFFEVKGVMSGKDMEKINALIGQGFSVTVGMDDGKFRSCGLFGDNEFLLDDQRDSILCRCNKCGCLYFSSVAGSWECQCCGYHDGSSTMSILMWGDGTLDRWDIARQARFEYGEYG